MTTPQLRQVERQGLQLLSPLQSAVQGLSITDERSYLQADTLLGRVVAARKTWAAEISPIIRPLKAAIASAKLAMKGAADLDDKVDKPLEELERSLKWQMADYKTAEARQIEEAKLARDREEIQAKREMAEAERKLESARTKPIRERLAAARDAALTKIEVLAEELTPEPVRGETSTTRRTPSWRITDKAAFIAGVADGRIPLEMVEPWTAAIRQQFRDNPDAMKRWPGCELFDDITVVRK